MCTKPRSQLCSGRAEDYIFALLTGYRDAPAGVPVNEDAGQYYNPYFAGGKIGMPVQLIDGAVRAFS